MSCLAVSVSELYHSCVNAINCTGKHMSTDLLLALGSADAQMYLCSEDIRPRENNLFIFIYLIQLC